MSRIFIIEDDEIMADCIKRAILSGSKTSIPPRHEILNFTNAYAAMPELNAQLPDLILLDVLLDGPDGFTLLNELISYPDTANIPVIIITSLNLSTKQLSHYGVTKILRKDTMTPADISGAVQEALHA